MTIAIGNTSQGHDHSNTMDLSWTHINDGEYLVGVGGYNQDNPGCWFDGNVMTRRAQGTCVGRASAVWTLDDPTVASRPFTMQWANPGYMHGGGLSLFGVDEADPIRHALPFNNGTGAGPISITLATQPYDLCFIAAITDHGSGALVMTPGADQTEFVTDAGVPYSRLSASYKIATDTSTTLTYTLSRAITRWAIAAVAIKPLTVPSGGPRWFF